MKSKRLICALLILCMVAPMIPLSAQATEVTSGVADARTGEIEWEFRDGVLYLTGDGHCVDECPWEHLSDRIESIVFSGTLSIVGEEFSDFPNLTSITWPEGLNSVSYAFNNCTSLESVSIPDCVTKVTHSFNNCYVLSDVHLPTNLENLTECFKFSTCLTQITIPNKITMLCSSFIYGGLVTVTIPASVENMLYGVFDHCAYLEEICFLGSAPDFDDVTFKSVTATAYYPKNRSGWTEETRTTIGPSMTWQAVSNPASVEMEYDPYWSIHNGVLTIIGSGPMKDEIPWYDASHCIRKIVLADGITSIPKDAFYGTSILESVLLPDSLEEIGPQSFDKSALPSIDIPSSVTQIGEGAFSFCKNLSSISIPDGVTELNDSIFSGCESLTNVSLPDGLVRIGDTAFSGCKALNSFTIPANVETIGAGAFNSCSNLKEIHFAGDAPSIGEYTFSSVTATAYYHADKAGWTEEVMQNYNGNITWVPYHVHSYTSVVTAPTCTDKGYTTFTCECGDSYVDNYVNATGHSYFGTVAEYDAENRTHTTICTVCGVPNTENCTFSEEILKAATRDEYGTKKHTCTVCGGSYQAYSMYRVSGSSRSKTAFEVADELKDVLAVDKFEIIILASGENFADALAGSYLAAVKNAPILLYRASAVQQNVDYITQNLADGGTVYILGGTASVSQEMEDILTGAGITVKRLAGSSRYNTNLEILKEVGITGNEILVSTALNFADSLSASATGKPILLVNSNSNKLTDAQVEFLSGLEGINFTIIGGTSSVSEELAAALEAYGAVGRVSGTSREKTSVAVAERYFTDPDYVLIAYSQNFPDGLCGGPLAYSLNAPLLLTNAGKEAPAADYVAANGITKGIILGGTNSISDGTVQTIFPVLIQPN